MRGGADDLDAPLVRAVVGARALEGGQERVVDVDRVRPVALAEVAGEDLCAVVWCVWCGVVWCEGVGVGVGVGAGGESRE